MMVLRGLSSLLRGVYTGFAMGLPMVGREYLIAANIPATIQAVVFEVLARLCEAG